MIKLKVSSDKTEISQKIKDRLENLPQLINEIKYYEVGLNLSKSPSAHDIVLVSRFDSLETLEAYRIHPEHKKVLDLKWNLCGYLNILCDMKCKYCIKDEHRITKAPQSFMYCYDSKTL